MYGAILGDIIGSPFEFDRGSAYGYFRLITQIVKRAIITVELLRINKGEQIHEYRSMY